MIATGMGAALKCPVRLMAKPTDGQKGCKYA
jgi:hypothetical protein